MSIRILIPILLTSMSFSGCALQKVSEATDDGYLKVRSGLVSDASCKANRTTIVSVSGFGLTRDNSHFHFGFLQSRKLCAASDCSVVFWIADKAEADRILETIPNLNGICVFDGQHLKQGQDQRDLS